MGNNSTATESILLVDDNPTNLQVLFQTLEGVGCKLLIAKNGNGALTIAGVSQKGPAEQAGLEKGDVIKSFDGYPINVLADLKLALYYCRQDQTTSIQVQRGDQVLEKEITLLEFNSFSGHMKK